MGKAVGARTVRWLWRAALVRGVLGWMVGLLALHCLVLPRGSAIGGFLRICLEGGRTHCFFPAHILLVPDACGGWSIDEEGRASAPGVIEVVFGLRRWSEGIASPTRRCTYRFLQVYDTGTMAPVTLPPAAAAVVRRWFANPAWAADFDEALAGRMGASVPLPEGYAQNSVLGAQALGVAWCLIARAWARSKAQNERQRRAQGVCVRCAYPIVRSGVAACPECGRAYEPEDVVERAGPVELAWSDVRGGPFDEELRA